MDLSIETAFTEADLQQAALCKALAHPARVAILRILAARQSCVCGELVDELPLAQATVSQHLRELKNAGLIQGTIDGPRVCYCLAPEGVARLRQFLTPFFESLSMPDCSDCC